MFTHKRFYTETPLHTNAFTHQRNYKHIYTQTLLHTNFFTHKHFYPQALVHAGPLLILAKTHQFRTPKHHVVQKSCHRTNQTHNKTSIILNF